MAKTYEQKEDVAKKYNIPDEYQYTYKKEYSSDESIHRQYISTFDPLEAMLIGTVYDTVSNSVDSSRITDSYATTLARESADREMAKLPDGNTSPMGKADIGKAAFMDILRQKWIYPNANAQHPFAAKLNMWQFYKKVYGYMPMFYDWNVSSTGYNGPDCWLWNPRMLIPQQGRISVQNMEYLYAQTYVSDTYLQEVLDDLEPSADENVGYQGKEDPKESDSSYEDSGWHIDALKLLIQVASQMTNPDPVKDSKVVRERTPQAQKRGVLLCTRYEAGEEGEWITFAPDHGYIEVRRLKNPHKNGRIPFVVNYSQRLFDSFYGLGDFQRAKPLQFARDGLTNFYFEGIKMNLIPPIIANANGVVKHTIDYRAGGVMLETIPNSIRRLETSTAGLATYQAAQEALTGSLLAMYGSQNASISTGSALNPSQGKTPQAIGLYADKEATRDGANIRELEMAIEELTEGFYSLVVNIGTEDIPVSLFADDIQDIVDSGLTDIEGLFENFKKNKDGSAGDLKIKPSSLKGVEYRFKIDPDSTAKSNKQAMLQSLEDYMGSIAKFQNILTTDPGVTINWDEIMSTYESLTGIPNAHKFMTFDPQASQTAKVAAAQAEQQQPSTTSIQMPTGQIHESADLGKLYLNTGDWWIKNQILTVMGFQPAPPEVQQQITQSSPDNADTEANGPTISSSGHAFTDPALAKAADAIMNHETPVPVKAGEAHPKNLAAIGSSPRSQNG